MCSDGIETESRGEDERKRRDNVGWRVDFARVEEEGLKNIGSRSECAEVRRNCR